MKRVENIQGLSKTDDMVKNWLDTGNESGDQTESLAHSLGNVFQVIRDNRWGILVLMLMGSIAGVFKAISETPIYQAQLTMSVEPSTSGNSQTSLFDPYAFRFYETQYELLKSRSVAERVVDRLKLVERPAVQKMLVPPSITQSLIQEVSKITGLDFSPSFQEPEETVALTPEQAAQKKAWLTGIIQGGVNISGGDRTNLVRVTFRSTNPLFAAEVANALVEAYIEQGLDSQANRSEQTALWLSQRIVGLKESLDTAQSNLQSFLLAEGMLDSTSSSQMTTNELQALNAEYLAARSNYDDLTKRYGERHPKITEARAELNATKARLDNKSRNISLSRSKQIELARLEGDVEVNQELYEAFLAKFKEADLSSTGAQVQGARIIDKALPPGGPIYPQKQKIIFTWGVGGLLIGVMLAFLREQLDSTFRNPRVIENKLGLPLFGVVEAMSDDIKTIERHYLDNKRSVFSESINHIRTGVTYSNVDQPPKVILITSSVQSEGKTTIASNLALAYAQLGSTLLIDADLRRPRIKHIVDTQHQYGLVDYVAGMASLKECVIQDSEEKNLFILNSGTIPPNPLELLASDKFSNIIEALRANFTYIIVDAAPVLPASDAVVLGQLSDALLMVVQADRTTHHMVRDAIKRLRSSKVDIQGLILSRANVKKNNPYHYGGYYGYGSYAYTYVQDDK